MSTRIKFYLLFGTMTMDFVYAATSPIIQIYFISQISSSVLAMANILSTAIAAGVNATISLDKMKDMYRRNFHWIMLIDIVCFCMISFKSLAVPEVRFLGMAILNAISSTLWFMVMQDAINHQIEGDALTKWESMSKSANLMAALFGSIFAIIFTNLPVEACIAAQCIANLVMGASDWQAYRRIRY